MASASTGRLRQLSLAAGGSGFARLAERAHLTITGIAVLVLVVVGWLAAHALGARTMYMMVYAALLAMMLAWFVSRRRLALTVERSQLPLRMRVGQTVPVELKVRTERRVSTILLEESIPERIGRPVYLPIGGLRPGQELTQAFTMAPTLRGVYQIGPTTATWSDPFGFTTHQQIVAEACEIVVHPQVEPVHDRVLTRMWEDPPIRPPVSKPWPVGFEFYGMRDYVPGDDLRRVVWTAYAKTGRLLVRESEQGITDRVVILIDTHREWHSPGTESDTFETGIKAAASLGVRHLRDGFSVSLMTNDGYAARGLRGGHLPFLDEMARLQMSNTPLSQAGSALMEESRTRPHVIVVTPHLADAEAQQLKLIVDRGVGVVVVKLIWEEADPLSLARAAGLGCQVVQLPPGASLDAVFAHQVGAGLRR